MGSIVDPTHLLNPLATSNQLETSASQLDGVPKELEDSVRFETARLTQAAGILLRLSQEITASAIVLLFRFWTGPDGGSLLEHDSKDVAAASLYLAAKPTDQTVSPRQVLTVIEYVCSLTSDQLVSTSNESKLDVTWSFSDAQFESARNRLYSIESHILRVLGYQTHVALPYKLCINYLQTMDVFPGAAGRALARLAFAHLNKALLSPQLLFLTHEPSSLATASIYLAARETEVKLPEVEWWEVFDVDREELGFLVVAFRSLDGFANKERELWGSNKIPLTISTLQAELKKRTESWNVAD